MMAPFTQTRLTLPSVVLSLPPSINSPRRYHTLWRMLNIAENADGSAAAEPGAMPPAGQGCRRSAIEEHSGERARSGKRRAEGRSGNRKVPVSFSRETCSSTPPLLPCADRC